jgi:hypothetical protein
MSAWAEKTARDDHTSLLVASVSDEEENIYMMDPPWVLFYGKYRWWLKSLYYKT